MGAIVPALAARRVRLGLRARLVLVSTLLLALVQLVGGMLFVRAQRADLYRQLDEIASDQLVAVRDLVESGQARTPLHGKRDLYIQVIDAEGRVTAASANVSDMTAFVDVARFPTAVGRTTARTASVDGARVRLVSMGVRGAGKAVGIYVGCGTRDVDASLRQLSGRLLAIAPLIVLATGAILWLIVTRALRPVDRLRREVDAIGPRDLSTRVSTPDRADEIGQLATTMNAMLGRLEESSLRQSQFVSDASHELRSPLAVMRTKLEIALRHPSQDWPATARSVLGDSARMERLVGDLLALARSDHDRAPARADVELDAVVRSVVAEVRPRASAAIDATGVSGGIVRGDEGQLHRVVANLIENAVQHARARVAVSLAPSDGQVALHVDDDGPGIAPDDRTRVFERFTRLDESRARLGAGAGSGLGLAIVADLVRAHGGTVAVDASPLGGARLTVTLPER